jgi:hypothetical protein
LDSNGVSGSILITWDKRVVEKGDVFVRVFSLAISFENVEDQLIWAFAGVYDANSDRNRRLL